MDRFAWIFSRSRFPKQLFPHGVDFQDGGSRFVYHLAWAELIIRLNSIYNIQFNAATGNRLHEISSLSLLLGF
eukprot:4854259-Heterocapsa_arctica.AAC.1